MKRTSKTEIEKTKVTITRKRHEKKKELGWWSPKTGAWRESWIGYFQQRLPDPRRLPALSGIFGLATSSERSFPPDEVETKQTKKIMNSLLMSQEKDFLIL